MSASIWKKSGAPWWKPAGKNRGKTGKGRSGAGKTGKSRKSDAQAPDVEMRAPEYAFGDVTREETWPPASAPASSPSFAAAPLPPPTPSPAPSSSPSPTPASASSPTPFSSPSPSSASSPAPAQPPASFLWNKNGHLLVDETRARMYLGRFETRRKPPSLAQRLGEGSTGKVYVLAPQPTKVVKVFVLRDMTHRTRGAMLLSLEDFVRECFFLDYLNKHRFVDVPALHERPYVCEDKGYIQMERVACSLDHFARRQAAELGLRKGQALYTEQLVALINLASTLDQLGILHGDVRMANLLVRHSGAIMLGDWNAAGFAPHIATHHARWAPLSGWTHALGASDRTRPDQATGRLVLADPMPGWLAFFFNRWQLLMMLLFHEVVWVSSDRQHRAVLSPDAEQSAWVARKLCLTPEFLRRVVREYAKKAFVVREFSDPAGLPS
jgi:hypothetical protein